jgi:metal-dependent amidase/aminoacylase/carboxypeptidase family protein
MAMVLASAALLVEQLPEANVRFVSQPAEESDGGARTRIADGVLENVSAIYAGHVTHDYKPGTITIRDGVMTSQSDRFKIKITGESGHGARPREATDAMFFSISCGALRTYTLRISFTS